MDDSRPLAWAPVGAICQIRKRKEEQIKPQKQEFTLGHVNLDIKHPNYM